MNYQEVQETDIWTLYERGRNFHRQVGIYSDTDRNHRMYNGNQWAGAKFGDVEPVQKNVIKPIVKYKVSVIHDNLYAINFSSQNYKNAEFQKTAINYCSMLNRYANKVWEKEEMDYKGRRITKDAAINDEGVMYVYFDESNMMPVCEIYNKNDIYYGNENDDNIQKQPYIILKKRMSVTEAIDLAESYGLNSTDIKDIIGDNDIHEESGEAAKEEVNDGVTVLYKMYRKRGTVHFTCGTRYVEFQKDIDMGMKLYPVAHMVWEEKKGSARGEGEVRNLIPNQIEINKTEMRRVLTVANQAYPQKIVNTKKVKNSEQLGKIGGIIKTDDATVDDVRRIVGIIPPVQMSSDVKLLQDDLITLTRDLAGAGDSATGNINPETASGRAILAVQQASQAPMTEQKESYKKFIEDVAKIWLEYLIVYSSNGIELEEEYEDPISNERIIRIVHVPHIVLEQLQATVKIDVTPKSVYDRFAQEQVLESLLTGGWFNPQKIGELEAFVNALPDDSVAPKQTLLEIIKNIKENQRKIMQATVQGQIMQQKMNQFLMSDINGQASQLAEIGMQQSAGVPA